ncbi:LCP family protein [Streptomyces sp. ODS28]|uniref:LCP family protein n=1 Tax=Streptomyces sp. ODS28 TaxID=3136688 RepID=UPI0031F0F04A
MGNVMVSDLDQNVRRVDAFKGMKGRPGSTDGLNFLVVGTDKRDKISDAQRKKYNLGGSACDCTDTLLLVHVSAEGDRASVVSLPRDSYAELPPHKDKISGKWTDTLPAKLNSAYTHGGPQLTAQTVEKMTGVHLDHYLEVDFTSFMRTVDTLGGVPVCTDKPLKDDHSGLDLPAGTSNLNGGEALQYVRARHLDAAADIGRMQRQQRFLASVLTKATDSGVLLNPAKFQKVSSAMLSSVRADPGFGTEQMMQLGQAMRGFSPSSSEFVSVPIKNTDNRVPGLGSTVQWDDSRARDLFGKLRADKPLAAHKKKEHGKEEAKQGEGSGVPVEVAPDNVKVQVENGTGTPGLGHKADQALRGAGFDTTGIPRNAEDKKAKHTVISYDPRWDASARSLAKAVPGAELKEEKGRGPVMRVTVGSDYKDVRKVRASSPDGGSDGAPEPDGKAVTGDKVACS